MRAVAIAIGRSGPAWSETLACAQAPRAGTGRSLAHLGRKRRRIASGRRGATAGDERAGEVRLRHSSWEADERSRATGRGAGGAKGGDRGESGSSKHAPGAVLAMRVPGDDALTASRQRLAVSPKVGAVCGNSARTDLGGGRAAMRVPTAIKRERGRGLPGAARRLKRR